MSNLFGDDYNGRKATPIFEGVLMYFPKAVAAIAEVSEAGNQQHNPGQPLHWARGKSMDQYNTAVRHLMDHRMGGGRIGPPHSDVLATNNGWIQQPKDKDGARHLAKAAWRILAALELAIEEEEADNQGETGIGARALVPQRPSPQPKTREIRRCTCGDWFFDVVPGTSPDSAVYRDIRHWADRPCHHV